MISAPFLLGIDLGTSAVKAIVIDAAGRVLGESARSYPIREPYPGWAEQDPEGWLVAALAAGREAIARSGEHAGGVAAVGLSGQMHGLVCLGSDGHPLRPAITWADRRSVEQVAWLEQRFGREQFGLWTGNPPATGFMLPSWLWVRQHEPEIARQTRCLLVPKDYLRYRLTGELASEPSDASGTLLFSPIERRWCPPLLDALEIDPSLLPPLHTSGEPGGRLLPEMARAFGLPDALPVACGAGDQAAQALGRGLLDPGRASCTIGTGGQWFAPLGSPRYDPQLRVHLFCHALPKRCHLLAAILAAGLALLWLRDNILQSGSFQELADAAGQAQAGAEKLFFTPYLAGERTPHMDPEARAAFVGLALGHTRAHLARAVMEGVVFAMRQGLEIIQELGAPVEQVVASGGATKHPLWLQLEADCFNRPIYLAETVEAAALGAALLGGVAAGVYPDAREAARQAIRLRPEPILPDPRGVEKMQAAYETFIKIYPALKGIYR